MLILVADSSPHVRYHLHSNLQDWGYTTANAEDVSLAKDLLSLSSSHTLILLSWGLPGLLDSGLLTELENPNIYTIFLLPDDEIPLHLQSMQGGNFDVINGPITPAVLQIRLRNGEKILTKVRHESHSVNDSSPEHQLQAFTAQIAHNINTPLQFMGDSLGFLEESFRNLEHLMAPSSPTQEFPKAFPPASKPFDPDQDMQALLEEIPKAIKLSQQGLLQVHRFVSHLPANHVDESNSTDA